jgi:hypothetical protein
MEAIRSSETKVLAKVTLRNIQEDGIPHSHRRDYRKSYIALTGWVSTVRYELDFYIPEYGILRKLLHL